MTHKRHVPEGTEALVHIDLAGRTIRWCRGQLDRLESEGDRAELVMATRSRLDDAAALLCDAADQAVGARTLTDTASYAVVRLSMMIGLLCVSIGVSGFTKSWTERFEPSWLVAVVIGAVP